MLGLKVHGSKARTASRNTTGDEAGELATRELPAMCLQREHPWLKRQAVRAIREQTPTLPWAPVGLADLVRETLRHRPTALGSSTIGSASASLSGTRCRAHCGSIPWCRSRQEPISPGADLGEFQEPISAD
jgi:hypothetical protein